MMSKTTNILTFCMIVMFGMSLTACAQTKKTKKTTRAKATNKTVAATAPKLIQATSLTTHPGRAETPSTTETRMVLVWKDKNEPTAFFWRGEGNWQSCEVYKVKNFRPLVVKNNGIPQPMNYEIVNNTGSFAAGDTLELYPISGGKYPMPAEIPTAKNNIIYYKTANSKWLALPVEKITKLPTIAMP